jgi:hypothetical protein
VITIVITVIGRVAANMDIRLRMVVEINIGVPYPEGF